MEYQRAIEDMHEINPDALMVDGYDDCIVGYIFICNKALFLYDIQKIVNKMVRDDSMNYDEAMEYFEYNILGAYMGEYTPAFIDEEAL